MREIRSLRLTRRGLETWYGRDAVTLADERASQRGTQTSTYAYAPIPDPTKALKQNLKIKTFVGTSANAVRTQIWTALITMLLLRYLQLSSRFGWSLSNLVALLRMNLFTHRDLMAWLDQPFAIPPDPDEQPQATLVWA